MPRSLEGFDIDQIRSEVCHAYRHEAHNNTSLIVMEGIDTMQ